MTNRGEKGLGWLTFPLCSLEMKGESGGYICAAGELSEGCVPSIANAAVLIVVLQGSVLCSLWEDAKAFCPSPGLVLGVGDVCLCPSGAQVSLEAKRRRRKVHTRAIFIAFQDEDWLDFLQKRGCRLPLVGRLPGDGAADAFEKCLRGRLDLMPTSRSGYRHAYQELEAVLWHLYQQRGALEAEPRYSPLVDRVLQCIDASFTRDIALEDLAQQMGVTPQHLSRTFRRETQMRLLEYIARKRISRGMELLWQGVSPGEVGAQVGYTSPAYFRKVFRRYTGETPETFLQKNDFGRL